MALPKRLGAHGSSSRGSGITAALCATLKTGELHQNNTVWVLSPPFCLLTEPSACFISRLLMETWEGGVAHFNYTVETTSYIASNIKHFFFSWSLALLEQGYKPDLHTLSRRLYFSQCIMHLSRKCTFSSIFSSFLLFSPPLRCVWHRTVGCNATASSEGCAGAFGSMSEIWGSHRGAAAGSRLPAAVLSCCLSLVAPLRYGRGHRGRRGHRGLHGNLSEIIALLPFCAVRGDGIEVSVEAGCEQGWAVVFGPLQPTSSNF